MTIFPTSHTVAVAIVAAARELGDKNIAIDVANGVQGTSGSKDPASLAASRARAYAAIALRKVFPDCSVPYLAKCVAAGTPGSYIGLLDSRFRKNEIKWWDPTKLERVVASIEAHLGAQPAPSKQAIKLSTDTGHYVSVAPPRPPEKMRLERMLQDAIRNTVG